MTAATAVEKYYRIHSRIYDVTRWSFLFGRDRLIQEIARIDHPASVLEVGCGTGKNLAAMARRFPAAQLTGLDLSNEMLSIAEKKLGNAGYPVALMNRSYRQPVYPDQFDLVVFSYALSMFNPGWRQAIWSASRDLCSGGLIAVVDFHDSPVCAFKKWMGVNHVRMDGHLSGLLRDTFEPIFFQIYTAYFGMWRYVIFIGRKRF
ncbi:MAG: class I SAM-dependent methyltransferase [Thermodesulfobacteriota bacterium]